MATETAIERDARQAATLDRLLSEKNPGRYAVFFEVGRGRFMRDDLEEMTGYVVDDADRVHRFTLAWDDATQAVALTEWKQVRPKASWGRVGEYRRARAAVGLD
jgi:hypothetical protein